MPLKLNAEKVRYVLLADGWHEVAFADGKSTFDVDSYEFVEGSPTAGASWKEKKGEFEHRVMCSLTSVLAVQERVD
ncbi:MAG: hypothetical protein ACREQ7_03660 [Candidatus Binatia bacterium]